MPVIDLSKLLRQFLYDPSNPLLFNNGFFVFFFAVFMLVYYLLRHQLRWRTYATCFFSLYFFYKASGWFVLLVIASAVVDYFLSNLIYRQTIQARKKILLLVSVVINLSLLFYFKYTHFFIVLCNDVLATHLNPLNILLPVGISFYTFENLSYTIDVYKGEFAPIKQFSRYLLFLSFFPKLVMGPIVRAKDFIPEISRPDYAVQETDFARGFYLIVSGLFKKLVISDYITLNLVNYVFDDPARHAGVECLFALYGYAIVIYCDFSGYSDVAIGIARWLGIRIPANFKLPYLSPSVTEFWKRWHISLSSWLRDYLYIFALGGNRKGRLRTYINLFATMLLGGFWHGASWNFLLWGAMHGFALVVHKLWMRHVPATGNNWLANTGNFLGLLLTFHFVCFCWIFFKAENMHQSVVFIRQLLFHFDGKLWPGFVQNYRPVLWMMALGYALHLVPKNWMERLCLRLELAPVIWHLGIFIAMVLIYLQVRSSTPVMPIYLQF